MSSVTEFSVNEWSIAAFYKKAWHVVTTYKQLWLLGLAVMAFAGSSVNFNSSFNSSDFQQETEVEAQVMEPESLMELDEELMTEVPSFAEEQFEEETSETAVFDELWKFFGQVLAKVNPLAWFLGGLTGTFFVVISLINYVVAGSWAKAALILGVAEAVKDKSPDITKNSVAGLDYVKGVFFIGLAPWIAYSFFTVVSIIVALIIGLLFQTTLVSFLLAFVIVIALLGGLILTTATINLGIREAVLFSTGGRVGLTRGWLAAKKGWRKALSLLFWNVVTEVVATIGLFLPALVALLMVFASLGDEAQLPELGFMPFIPTIILAALGFVAYFIFKAAYNVFTFTTWHLAHAYLRITTSSANRL